MEWRYVRGMLMHHILMHIHKQGGHLKVTEAWHALFK